MRICPYWLTDRGCRKADLCPMWHLAKEEDLSEEDLLKQWKTLGSAAQTAPKKALAKFEVPCVLCQRRFPLARVHMLSGN